jgi:hypothetical protein
MRGPVQSNVVMARLCWCVVGICKAFNLHAVLASRNNVPAILLKRGWGVWGGSPHSSIYTIPSLGTKNTKGGFKNVSD